MKNKFDRIKVIPHHRHIDIMGCFYSNCGLGKSQKAFKILQDGC